MDAQQFHYEFERGGDERVRIVLHGELVGPSLAGLNDDVQERLTGWPASAGVLVDLTDVTRCDRGACRTLARIQRRLGAHGCRTAWIASRPRIRGAAWWIVHASGDRGALPVTDDRFAEDWLAQDGERLDQMESRTTTALDRAVRALSGLRGGAR